MVVLEGQHVLPKRTLANGFKYQYPTLKQALEEILSSTS
jgi:NAD dependent epimerase/dehydratase family enzyme